MMKYGARKFNKSSYDVNDNLAKEIFKDYVKDKRGHNIVSDIETYDHDIITSKNGEIFLFEVEIKHGYPFTNKKSFKFETVSFLGRKKRLHEKSPFYYVIICFETNWAIICHSDEIYKQEYIEEFEIDKNGREGLDCFYRIPKSICKFVNLKNQ